MQTTARALAMTREYPAAKIVARISKIEEAKTAAGLRTDDQLARAIGVHATQLSRVMSGKSEPGNKFIAGVVAAFGPEAFEQLFAVVSDDEGAAA